MGEHEVVEWALHDAVKRMKTLEAQVVKLESELQEQKDLSDSRYKFGDDLQAELGRARLMEKLALQNCNSMYEEHSKMLEQYDSMKKDWYQANERIHKLEKALKNVRDNYDCDDYAHKHGTICRSCDAKEALKETDD